MRFDQLKRHELITLLDGAGRIAYDSAFIARRKV
jgi:hypothetical protein